jgi:hypothetical protein
MRSVSRTGVRVNNKNNTSNCNTLILITTLPAFKQRLESIDSCFNV